MWMLLYVLKCVQELSLIEFLRFFQVAQAQRLTAREASGVIRQQMYSSENCVSQREPQSLVTFSWVTKAQTLIM